MRNLLVFSLLAASALAQNAAPPAFEVASVKINPDPNAPFAFETPGNSVTIRNASMRKIMAWAYDIQWAQLDGPAWLDTERYDILARAARPATEAETRAMLRTLLIERFKIQTHRETRQVEVMALLLPKSGTHKMTPSKREAPAPRQDPVRGTVIEGVALAELCEDMTHDRGSIPVVDMTGLTGRWDFALNIQKYRDSMRSRAMASPGPVNEADLRLSFMQELIAGELGLRIELRKNPVEMTVIDKIDPKPTEN
jgi:uncharacterized protein (TIGR03435 family)